MTGEVDNVPVGPVAANQADAVPAFDAESLQSRGAASSTLGEVGRADGLEVSARPPHQQIGASPLFEPVKEIGECFHGRTEN